MSETDTAGGRTRVAEIWSSRIRPAAFSGAGGFVTIYILAKLGVGLDTLLLVAPFGASSVLVFALPQSPLAQPTNVIGGHLISTLIGILFFAIMGAQPVSFALAVGLAIAAMQATDTLHPPAGADPIVVLAAGASWQFLLTPILAGTIVIVATAICYHRFVSRRRYPL
jgi:CBS-domain-containing membrane protein